MAINIGKMLANRAYLSSDMEAFSRDSISKR